ncbi:MAG: peptidylprolyl isomerase [Bacteroidales bacterium]|nr:peptidylprolyl isomerase [Bacteroidales bacterium]
MKKYVLSFVILLSLTFSSFAQEDEIIMIIDNEPVTKTEFLKVYLKNNNDPDPYNEQSIRNYLDLFINYKLKVKQAIKEGLDTTKKFRQEFNNYKRQLAQNYLYDKETYDKLLNESYERSQFDLRVSHILIKLTPNASPADTLKAYKKALDIRSKILKGMPFEDAALAYSEDETVKDRTAKDGTVISGNKGDLGFFTVFNMAYEFETAAYNLKIDEISMPVRTQLGYHIIKLTDKRPALGKVLTAHILVQTKDIGEANAIQKINEAYRLIKEGKTFEEVAKEYSDDKGSATKGGQLPWFGCFRMVPEFITPLYTMKPGDISEPIRSIYGYHIIKLIDRKPVLSFEEEKNNLKNQLQRDKRYQLTRKALVEKLKKEYAYSYKPEVLKKLLPLLNDSLYDASWKYPKIPIMKDTLCKIGKKVYTLEEFADFFMQRQSQLKRGDDWWTFILFQFDNFIQDKIIEYEYGQLERKYQDFADLVKEYHDGILLFELMDQKVWSRAVKDTTGLKEFYKTVQNKYMYGERADVVVFTTSSENTAKSLERFISKKGKKVQDPITILKTVVKDTSVSVKHQEMKVEKGTSPLVEKLPWKPMQVKIVPENNNFHVVWIKKILAPEPKPLNEVKGLVAAEYQNYLEEKWISELRSRYKWQINENVLSSLWKK